MQSSIQNCSNLTHPSALVKISAICSSVEQCFNCIVFASTWYWIKWYLILIFFANCIAELLSTNKVVEVVCFSCKSSRIFLSHTISFVCWVAATYSASVVESVGIVCFFDLQPEVDTPFSLSPTTWLWYHCNKPKEYEMKCAHTQKIY